MALYWRGRSELQLDNTEAAITTLTLFLQQYPTDQLARAAQFNLGQAYQQAGQIDTAVDAYLGTIIPNDPTNVYIYETIGDLYLSRGAYTETVAAYRNGIAATDDSGFKVHFGEGIAQAALLYGNSPETAIAEYQNILTIAKIPDYRAKILKLLGDAQRVNNNEAAALKSYREAVDNYPEAYDSYLALVELVNAEVPVNEFQRGLIDYYAEAYLPAIAAFERYLTPPEPTPVLTTTTTISATGSLSETTALSRTAEITETVTTAPFLPPNADEALWLMGRSYRSLGQYNNAIATFQRLIEAHPNSTHYGEATVEIGKTLFDQESYTQGKAVLRQFAAENPNHPLAAEALWRAARLEMDQDLPDEAYTHLRQLAQQYPNSDYTTDALYWAGRMAYLQENYETAIESWTILAETYPTSDLVSFAGYWRARALSDLGRQGEADQLLAELADGSADYYRLRAKDRLSGQLPQSVPLAIPADTQLSREQAEAEAWLADWLKLEDRSNLSGLSENLLADINFQRGRDLLTFGLRDKAAIEFEAVKDTWWDDPLAMYRLATYFHENQLGRLGILAAARVVFLSPANHVGEAPIYIQRLYYPFHYNDLIFAEADALDIDPALVVSLIRQESLFEPTAESWVGARGLMQVMPATGEYVAERSNFGEFDTDLLWLPYVSVKFGAWYISQQLGIFDGNQFAAMAAYNAGPGNVQDWIKTSDDLDIFVEAIPFWESRTYIRRVYENLSAYRRIYGNPPSSN